MSPRSDKRGKRALFETPPIEVDDTLKDDPLVDRHDAEGQDALYSVGHREPGTTVITCSRCHVKTRTPLVETLVRILAISLWFPTRAYSRWIQCPACLQRAWCRIEWTA